MGDVGERAAMDEGRVVLEGLHQIGRDRVLQQHGHGAIGLEVAGIDRLLVARITDDDVAKALGQVGEVGREAEDRHDFGGDGDVETVLAREAVRDAAQRIGDLTKGAIVHVHDAAPGNAARVEAEFVAPVDVVVDQGREQIVRRTDGVEVTGEMEVDVFHRHDLGVTAAGSATLHAEAGPEARLAQADDRLLADLVETVAEADRGRGLAFAGRGRVDRRHQDQLAVLLALQRLDVIHRDLGLGMAEGQQMVFLDAKFARNFADRLHFGFARDFDIAADLLRHGKFPYGSKTLRWVPVAPGASV